MLEFETIKTLKSNKELLTLFTNYKYKVKSVKIKYLKNTNLNFIKPTEYLITYSYTLTILEYETNEISNKNFYIKEHQKKYNLKEITILGLLFCFLVKKQVRSVYNFPFL